MHAGGPGALAGFIMTKHAYELTEAGPDKLKETILKTWADYAEVRALAACVCNLKVQTRLCSPRLKLGSCAGMLPLRRSPASASAEPPHACKPIPRRARVWPRLLEMRAQSAHLARCALNTYALCRTRVWPPTRSTLCMWTGTRSSGPAAHVSGRPPGHLRCHARLFWRFGGQASGGTSCNKPQQLSMHARLLDAPWRPPYPPPHLHPTQYPLSPSAPPADNGMVTPGFWTTYGTAFYPPQGRIHWCACRTAPLHHSYQIWRPAPVVCGRHWLFAHPFQTHPRPATRITCPASPSV